MTNNQINLWQKFLRHSKARRTNTRATKFSLGNLMPEVPNLGSLVLGVLIGIFLTSLVVFAFSTSDITLKIPTGTTIEAKATPQQENDLVATAEPVSKEPTKPQVVTVQEPKFDFYTELAENTSAPEVKEPTVKKVAPISTPATPTAKVAASTAKAQTLALKSKQATINEYIVQAGSFRRMADADALKAKLVLNGLPAKIESNRISNGETWSRVVLGPLKTEYSAKELQKVLKTIDVDSILVLKPVANQRG